MSKETPPGDDELEVSLVGPGRGESIIIHIGSNEWAIVDSCIPRGTARAAALDYLSSLGVDPSTQVRLVVATHWHDDHIRGLAEIVKVAKSARFVCSSAIQSQQFFELVEIAKANPGGTGGLTEFGAILNHLEGKTSPTWAIENRELFAAVSPNRAFPVNIRSLSPSDQSVTKALQELGSLIPTAGKPLVVESENPNHTSVVLWLEASGKHVLLGADLQNSTVNGRGWSAVVAAHAGRGGAGIYKIPHHGSSNADNDDIWATMVQTNAIAAVAPYNGGKWLPSKADRQRLLSRTSHVYCTAKEASAPPKRPQFVEKRVREFTKQRRVVVGPPGHLRIRWRVCSPNSVPTVEMFDGAHRLEAEPAGTTA
ncbi:MAG: MBL fold metallo-hydrolase [Vicinamibacterales bacterium]